MRTKSAEKSHGGRRRLKLTVSKDLGSEMVSFLPKMITECWYFEGFFPTDKLFDSKRMICACVEGTQSIVGSYSGKYGDHVKNYLTTSRR